jgi:hypothetical protein
VDGFLALTTEHLSIKDGYAVKNADGIEVKATVILNVSYAASV